MTFTIGAPGVAYQLAWGTINGNAFGFLTEPAGYSVSATAPAEGNHFYQQDMSVGTPARIEDALHIDASADIAFAPPDATKRWAARWYTTYITPAAAPAAKIQIATDAASSWILYYTTSKTLQLLDQTTGTALGTSAVALSNSTEYGIDVWRVYKDSAGVDLPRYHWIVRVYSNLYAASAATTVDTLEAYQGRFGATGGHLSVGATAADANNPVHAFGVTYSAIEDADNPSGLPRIAWYKPTANGAFTAWTPNASTLVSQIQDGPPDDATTFDFDSTSGHEMSFSLTGQGTTPGASDSVLFVNVAWRYDYGQSKGSTAQLGEPFLYDGTNKSTKANVSTQSTAGTWGSPQTQSFQKNAAGSTWAQTDLAALQIGMHDNSTGGTLRVTAMHAYVAWVKSGETIPALPPDAKPQLALSAPIIAPRPQLRTQVLAAPIAVLTATVVTPVTPQRRRFVWVS